MSSTSKRFRLTRPLVVALAATLPGGSLALADAIDPAMPRKIVVGSPKGDAPSDRLGPERRGRTALRLPYPPVEQWEKHVSGGLDTSPVVDDAGDVLVASVTGEVTKLGPDDREIWHVHVGTSPPSTSPILTSDGTLVVITSSGQTFGITPSGAVRYSVAIGTHKSDDTAPLATSDGGVVVAAGHTVVEIDSDGEVRARATVEERPIGALVKGPEGTIITGESGAVYSWRPPLEPKKLGSLGGTTKRGGAALADDRTLLAVVDSRRIVAFDLKTGTAHVRSGSATTASFFDGPVAVSAQGYALAATETGVLLGLDAAGNEKIHVAIEKPPPSADAGAGGVVMLGPSAAASFFGVPAEFRPSPPVIVDRDGRIAFVRNGGRMGVVNPEGNVAIGKEKVCSTAPISILPAGEKRVLVACKDANLWMFGE